MKINNLLVLTVACTMIGAAVGYAWRNHEQKKATEVAEMVEKEVEVIDTLPNATYPDLHSTKRNLGEFTDKLVVLNFWATWCAPCRQETPTFVELQSDYAEQVQFIGIAIDEPKPTQEFANEFRVNYPILIGGVEAAALSRRLGNSVGGLPFTVVATPGGKVVMRHIGELKREKLEPLLQQYGKRG